MTHLAVSHPRSRRSLLAALSALLLAASGHAAVTLFPPVQNWHPGTDGPFAPTADITVDLSQAPTGTWDQDNTANAGKGVYDPAKWAVVFKYSSVNIPAGVSVTFKNHASRAPVVWLVDGPVTIAGTVDLSGEKSAAAGLPTEPGPGGFRGGAMKTSSERHMAGLGPGGGRWVEDPSFGPPGSFGSKGNGANAGPVYGSPQLVPLIGGSGASGWYAFGQTEWKNGGAGGGAILIACTGQLSLPRSGSVQANGGVETNASLLSGGGSGGAIRIVADVLTGDGTLSCAPGGDAGDGRIRLEVKDGHGFTGTITPSSSNAQPGIPATIWPDGYPSVRIAQVADKPVGDDPQSRLEPGGEDIPLQTTTPQVVRVDASNVPVDGTWKVEVRVVPRNGPERVVEAVKTSGGATASVWEATIEVPLGFSVLQARAYKP